MGKIYKFIISSVLILSFSILIVGCGKDTSSNSNMDEPSKKKYIMGTNAAFAPFDYINEKGEIVGLEVEFAKALAAAGRFEIEIKNLGSDPQLFLTALNNNEVDFNLSAITITEDRKKVVDFSDPYFTAYQLILVREDSTESSLNDLKDLKVGVQDGTTGHEVVKKVKGVTNADIKAYETTPFAIQDLVNKTVDAVVADNAVVLEYIKQNPNIKVKAIEDDSLEKEYYGITVKKGNEEVLKDLNEAIKKVNESGKLKDIFGKDLQ